MRRSVDISDRPDQKAPSSPKVQPKKLDGAFKAASGKHLSHTTPKRPREEASSDGAQARPDEGEKTSPDEVENVTANVASFKDEGVSDVTEMDKGGIKKGSALRYKYRKRDSEEGWEEGDGPPPFKRVRVNPNQCGWHPYNRNGCLVGADRCEALLATLLGKFDEEEADHAAVAIEADPDQPRRFLEHTKKMCQRDERLAQPDGSPMVCASVGHSHVNQVFRNILNSAKTSHQSLRKIADKEGRISLSLVKVQDQVLARKCKQGLSLEMLSHKLELEEGRNGVELVQLTLNDAHSAAMSQHEMQAVRHLEHVILSTETSLVKAINHLEIWRKLCSDGGFTALAMSSSFQAVVDLIASTCKSVWLTKMYDFHANTINAKTRRVTWALIGSLSYIPNTAPYCRHAIFEQAYNKPINQEESLCQVVAVAKVKDLKVVKYTEFLVQTETVLERFHDAYQHTGAYDDMKEDKTTDSVLLLCDLIMAKALLSNSKDLAETIRTAELEAEKIIRGSIGTKGRSKLPPIPEHLKTVSAQAGPITSTVKKQNLPGPQVLQYNADGTSVMEKQPQLVSIKSNEVSDVDWVSTLTNVTTKDIQKAQIYQAINQLGNSSGVLPQQDDLITMAAQANMKGVIEVRAKRALNPGLSAYIYSLSRGWKFRTSNLFVIIYQNICI